MRINIEMNKGLRTVRKKAWVMKGVLLSFVLSLVVVFLLVGSVSAGAPLLHVEYANDLIEASTVIYDNTGKIADDTKLDEGLRAKAEEIHVASRELGNIAEVIREYVKELKNLITDPKANKAKIKEALDEVIERLEKCYAILEAKNNLVHAVLSAAPESHKEYADVIHDTYHEAGHIVEKFTEHVQELAESVGVAIPESTIKPVTAPEQFIRMYDKQGKLQNLLAEEVAVEAHGHLCVCGATAFRVTQVAISQLWGEEIPTKGELKVTYHHPGKGHKEVFEYLLGPKNVTYVKAGDPKHLTLEDNYVYTFIRKDTGVTWETTMKDGVIPEGFFDLRYQVKGFLNGWHKEKPTKLEKASFKQQFDEAVNNILSMEAPEIFEDVGIGEIAAEYQEDIEELTASAKELKKLVRRMSRPAHSIPGEIGGNIHIQFHRCEGFTLAIYDSVLELKKLAADPEKNKEKMRELVVEDLWGQLRGFGTAIDGMSDLIRQALTADPEDANTKKVQDILDEVADAQDTILEQVGVIEVAMKEAKLTAIPEAKLETVLTIANETETKALTLDEIKAMPPYTATGGSWSKHRQVVKGPFEYTGVELTDLLDLVGGISEVNELKVVASDEYAKVFTYDQVKGDLTTFDQDGNPVEWSQPITVVLAYEEGGKPIEIPEGGPLRIAITGPEEPITPGGFWVKWVEKIEIKEEAPE